jgi:beta-lactam-binding protein with PASTA domain
MNANRSNGGQIQVPNLVTMKLDAASSQLVQIGLVGSPVITTVDADTGGPFHEVIDQDPQPGQWL